jgi:aspartyl-tRNA(Asn)/glutamyl-tRNA(Gln) amidotransferase subunit C
MSKLSITQIEHIAKLSKLELSKEEKELYSDQLSQVLEYVEQLSEVDTVKVEPLSNVTGLENVTRADEILESGIKHVDIQKNAPKFDESSFVVPGVFE